MPSLPSIFAGVLTLLGAVGVGGLLTILRFQRQETGKILAQHQVVLSSMQTIVDEATEGFERMRAQRDHLERELRLCRDESAKTREEAHELRGEIARWRWEQRGSVDGGTSV